MNVLEASQNPFVFPPTSSISVEGGFGAYKRNRGGHLCDAFLPAENFLGKEGGGTMGCVASQALA